MAWDLRLGILLLVLFRPGCIGGFRTAANARGEAELQWPVLKAAAVAGGIALPETRPSGWGGFSPGPPVVVEKATPPVKREYNPDKTKAYTKVMDLPGFPHELARKLRGLKEIGRGQTGIVYRVEFPAWDQREFVLKHVIPPSDERAKDTKKEIDIMRSFGKTPGFVTYLGSVHPEEVKPGDDVYIMMERASGTFHEVIYSDLPHSKTFPLYVDVVRAVSEMHRAGIAHHDLKPSNVLIIGDCASEEGCSAVLCDLSMACTGSFGRWPTNAEREPMGTVPYIEPDERRKSNCEAGDVWALGVMLYEVLFQCMLQDFAEVANLDACREASSTFRIENDMNFNKAPEPLARLLAGMLNTDPAKRIKASEALRQIEKLSAEAGGSELIQRNDAITLQAKGDANALGEWSAEGPIREKDRRVVQLHPLFRQLFPVG